MILLPPPFADEAGKTLHIVVETPKGSRYKYAYQPDSGLFLLKRILPPGTDFPVDFGFVPHTLADDGDALDAVVLSYAPIAVGALVICRVLGILEAEQTDTPGQTPFRNDRLVCVPEYYPELEPLQSIADLGEGWVRDLERFFHFYRSRTGGSFRVVATQGLEEALEAVRKAATKAEGAAE